MAKHRRRSVDDGESNDDSDSDMSRERSRDHQRKKRKEHKSKHKKKHKKKKTKTKESKKRSRDEDYSSSGDSDSDQSRQERKKSKKQHRPTSDRLKVHGHEDTNPNTSQNSHLLTQALCHLFSARPVFAQELPILLIRLAGGSTFDLRQMNDSIAASALEGVLECLKDFGVQQVNDVWLFQALPGRRDERVLLRVIRSLLDEVGVTMPAVHDYEAKRKEQETHVPTKLPESNINDNQLGDGNPKDPAVDRIKDLTSTIVLKYQSSDGELGSQLSGLCQTIAQGEVISIDGLPDTQLKNALEEIFIACGLVKAEMSNDSDDDDDDDDDEQDGNKAHDEEPTMGYGLPDDANDSIILRLAAVMEACRNPKRRTMGPMKPTAQEASMQYKSEDEDEGPYLPGQDRRRRRGPSLPDHIVKAQAEHRELELKATAAGISIPTGGGGGREEWMIVPGKYDFLSNIKTAPAHKSRGFLNKKTRGGGGDESESQGPIHPAIQAELTAIMQAHKEARGPSLFDEHRAKIEQERAAKAGQAQEWSWSRDKDLDAGRRVDKDALHMVLGGAKDNLKTKFHGGFG